MHARSVIESTLLCGAGVESDASVWFGFLLGLGMSGGVVVLGTMRRCTGSVLEPSLRRWMVLDGFGEWFCWLSGWLCDCWVVFVCWFRCIGSVLDASLLHEFREC